MTDRHEFDVVVVGAGPAGIAAACCAAESGRSVAVLDDNPAAGGQIWRGAGAKQKPKGSAGRWLQRFAASGATLFAGTQVIDVPEKGVLLAQSAGCSLRFEAPKIILACGMRERFVPFPGWTLPQVMGVGGLQALVKAGMEIRGKRVAIAGSGPLLLAVASDLKERGAIVACAAEQAQFSRSLRFGASLWRHPAKVGQGIRLAASLRGVKLMHATYPTRVESKDDEGIQIHFSRRGRVSIVEADFLACGFGLVPNLELAEVMGCEIANRRIKRDGRMQTTQQGVYAPGLTPTGAGGVDQSLLEGQIAGYAAAGKAESAAALKRKARSVKRFADALDHAYQLRDELNELVQPDTIVCRCEDVTHSKLDSFTDWKHAKLQTRCGMGPCQGRVCGPAIEQLYGWSQSGVRPPVCSATISALFPDSVDAIVDNTRAPSSDGTDSPRLEPEPLRK